MSDNLYCKKCGNKMILLLVSAVCDTCDPPGGSKGPKAEINWWESFWFPFIGGTKDPTLSKLNKPLHTSNLGNLTNGVARAVVLFWPSDDAHGESKEAIVFDTKNGTYQHFNLMGPAKDMENLPGFPGHDGDENNKYIHELDPSVPRFGQYSGKYQYMVVLMDGKSPDKNTPKGRKIIGGKMAGSVPHAPVPAMPSKPTP